MFWNNVRVFFARAVDVVGLRYFIILLDPVRVRCWCPGAVRPDHSGVRCGRPAVAMWRCPSGSAASVTTSGAMLCMLVRRAGVRPRPALVRCAACCAGPHVVRRRVCCWIRCARPLFCCASVSGSVARQPARVRPPACLRACARLRRSIPAGFWRRPAPFF